MKEKMKLLSPLNWPAWIVLGILWLITKLPPASQIKMGRGIGKIIFHLSKKMRHITETNIKLCFPEFTQEQHDKLLKENFANLGIGLIETSMAWWISDKRLEKCKINISGVEHAEQAFAKGKGIILLGPHFTCLEMIGRLLGSRYSFAVMYRPHKKQLISYIQTRFRKKYNITQIARQHVRALLRTLNDNMAIWYAYDVDGGEKRSVFAPFFGIPTASLTAVTRIVNMSDAVIIPISFYRRDDCWGYDIKLLPALENFPSDNLVTDATRLNEVLEKSIREKPEQYIWQYKRFKTRPPGEKRFY